MVKRITLRGMIDMLKRFMIGLTIAVFGAVVVGFSLNKSVEGEVISDKYAIEFTKRVEQETPYSDEYSFHTYKITKVKGNEIIGVALDHKTPDNAGIYLLKNQLKTKLHVGDRITVVFDAESNDEILDVIKIQ